jgi:hypothetical protein
MYQLILLGLAEGIIIEALKEFLKLNKKERLTSSILEYILRNIIR